MGRRWIKRKKGERKEGMKEGKKKEWEGREEERRREEENQVASQVLGGEPTLHSKKKI